MKKTIIKVLLVLLLSACSNSEDKTTIYEQSFFKTIEQDSQENISLVNKYRVNSFFHEPQGGGDNPAINRQISMKNIRTINLYNVQSNKIENFKIYYYVFRWGSVGGSIYEPIKCSITAYPSRIHIGIPDDFVFENHIYDMDGNGNMVALQRKYYVRFNYFTDHPLEFHFLIQESEDEGISKTSFKEDVVGKKAIYVGN